MEDILIQCLGVEKTVSAVWFDDLALNRQNFGRTRLAVPGVFLAAGCIRVFETVRNGNLRGNAGIRRIGTVDIRCV